MAYSRRHSCPNCSPAAGANHSLQVDLDDLAALVRSLHMAPAHLVATSYGALVALGFALDHPREVLSLTLAEPPLHEWACRTAAGARLYAAFVNDVWIPARAAFDQGCVHDALRVLTDGIWGREIFASLPPHRVAAAARNAESMRALTRTSEPFSAFTRADVSRLSMPTLLVNGEHSSALHLTVVDELARVLPAATRAVISGAGHASPLENSDGFNLAMQEFLEGCRARDSC
jgi:pimeloyl-ACP methyl ester carboxylesterase